MPAAYDRCVKNTKMMAGVKNPYAVCRASMGSDAEIKARAARKIKPKRKK